MCRQLWRSLRKVRFRGLRTRSVKEENMIRGNSPVYMRMFCSQKMGLKAQVMYLIQVLGVSAAHMDNCSHVFWYAYENMNKYKQ